MHSRAVSSNFFRFRPFKTTQVCVFANDIAISLPIPELAPLINATFPLKLLKFIIYRKKDHITSHTKVEQNFSSDVGLHVHCMCTTHMQYVHILRSESKLCTKNSYTLTQKRLGKRSCDITYCSSEQSTHKAINTRVRNRIKILSPSKIVQIVHQSMIIQAECSFVGEGIIGHIFSGSSFRFDLQTRLLFDLAALRHQTSAVVFDAIARNKEGQDAAREEDETKHRHTIMPWL